MKKSIILLIGVLVLFSLTCKSKLQFKEYSHNKAGFKIALPTDWKKTKEDANGYEFRKGLYKMVEVVSRNLGIPSQRLKSLSSEEFSGMLKASTLPMVKGYWFIKGVKDYQVIEQKSTTWGGRAAYYIKTKGYSKEVEKKIVVDLITTIDKEKSRLYLFLSQVIEPDYLQVKPVLDSMIASFQIIP